MDQICSLTMPQYQGIFPKQQQTIDRVVKDIVARHPQNLSQIILYGSCARRTANYFSDVDIMLVYIEFNEQWHDDFMNLKQEIWNADNSELDLHATTEHNLKTSTDIFIRMVRKDGKILWEA